jgi:DNA-binding transcriptional ArsR family regulator
VSDKPRQPIVNSVGDLVLTDPQTMLALADPFRLQLFDRLRREGPLPVSTLASALDTAEASIRAALEELARGGLVDADGEVWRAAGRGFVFEIPDNPEDQVAGRRLANAVFATCIDLPGSWARDDEPRLPIDWIRASGVLSARVALTSDELRDLQKAIELVLEPYLTRENRDVPADAAQVRILSYFMPEAPPINFTPFMQDAERREKEAKA